MSNKELEQIYTPTDMERAFVNATYRRPLPRVYLMLQLKLVQRRGYSVALADVPVAIVAHICRKQRVRRPTKEALAAYDASGDKARHLKHVLQQLGLRDFDAGGQRWLASRAQAAAQTKQELPAIVNVLLEELVKHRYVLPGFTILLRVARAARERVNAAIFERTFKALTPQTIAGLDNLLKTSHGKSDWERLKREPKQPTTREVASYLSHIRWLDGLAAGLPSLRGVAATKLAYLTLEARALDAADMRNVLPHKRYTLVVLLIQAQLRKATDDIADIFVKTQRHMDTWAKRRLLKYQLEHTQQVERPIGRFRDVLTAYQQHDAEVERARAVGRAMHDDPEQLISECDEHMAYADNNYFPFMLRPYRTRRALLFECLDVLSPMATYRDDAFAQAIAWAKAHRNSHKERLDIQPKELDLTWLPEKWRRLIVGKPHPDSKLVPIHRKYFELCLLERIREELQSGDLYVQNSEQYDDYREHFIDELSFKIELPIYGELTGLPTDPDSGMARLRTMLTKAADEADRGFPNHDSISFGLGGLVIHQTIRSEPPDGFAAIDQAIDELLGVHSIIDILIDTERWLDLHKLFGPLSGYESKLEDPRERFIATLFCYGFNMGPSQTARSLKEQFNNFAQWAFFGNKGVITENLRHEQRKIVKYNHLVANMIILHNVQNMSKAITQLQAAGQVIDKAMLAATSPYRMGHINRYGDYPMDMSRRIEPLNYRFRFH